MFDNNLNNLRTITSEDKVHKILREGNLNFNIYIKHNEVLITDTDFNVLSIMSESFFFNNKNVEPLDITISLSEDTRKQGIWTPNNVVSLHIIGSMYILTDNSDYTKIYEITTVEFENYLNSLDESEITVCP